MVRIAGVQVSQLVVTVMLLAVLQSTTVAQCPWQKEVPDLQTSCLCAYNLAQELSVQCDQVSKYFFYLKNLV